MRGRGLLKAEGAGPGALFTVTSGGHGEEEAADALVTLGVGKNMVKSIRHWCLATQVAEPLQVTKKRGKELKPTELGHRLVADGGWDPYLEDPASLWLLHWLLLTSLSHATTWYVAFTDFHESFFTKKTLQELITRNYAKRTQTQATDRSLSRDIDCFIRTYVSSHSSDKVVLEDTLDCPFVELGLIRVRSDGTEFRFDVGPKASLPAAVFGFALVKYFEQRDEKRRTMSFSECLYGPGSPGQAFKLDENSVVGYMDELQEFTRGSLGLDETAGLKQIYVQESLDAMDLLSGHYENGQMA